MIKQTLYPKTKRLSEGASVRITEKLDGSNLIIFKYDGIIYIAQRNNIYSLEHGLNGHQAMYKGLSGWLKENHDKLDLHEGSVICGEWIGMGQIKYTELDKRFYMFAKANVTKSNDEVFELINLNYYHEYFKFPFESQIIPDCIGVVPVVGIDIQTIPTKHYLDDLYDNYESPDRVEGFIVVNNNTISKYVRYKDGKPSEHKG